MGEMTSSSTIRLLGNVQIRLAGIPLFVAESSNQEKARRWQFIYWRESWS